MIKCNVTNVAITLTETETLTAGRVGLECQFSFSSEWDGLAITAYFLGAVTKAVVVAGDTVTVPAEAMAEPGYKLYVGVVGKNAQGNIVIPTLWASAGKIKRSPGEEEEATPSPDVVAQIQLMAINAVNTANAAMQVITDHYEEIEEVGTEQVAAVNAAGTTQTGNVNTAGTTQINAIAAKGEEVLNSIPEDYTELSDDVDDLKSVFEATLESAPIDGWERGAISSIPGTPTSSTTRCRLMTGVSLSNGIFSVTAAEGYKLIIFAYLLSDDSYVGSLRDTGFAAATGALQYNEFNLAAWPETYYYKFVALREDGEVMELTEADNIRFNRRALDTTLTSEILPPQSKAVGDAIAAVSTAIPIVKYFDGAIDCDNIAADARSGHGITPANAWSWGEKQRSFICRIPDTVTSVTVKPKHDGTIVAFLASAPPPETSMVGSNPDFSTVYPTRIRLDIGGDTEYAIQETMNYLFVLVKNSSGNYVGPDITFTATSTTLQAVDEEVVDETNAVDRRNEIYAMLSAFGKCELGKGVFYSYKNLCIPDGAVLCGSGKGTTLKLLASVESGSAIKMGAYATIRDMAIKGSDTAQNGNEAEGSRNGVEWTGETQIYGTVDNCRVINFSGAGIYLHDTTQKTYRGLSIINCDIRGNYVGIDIRKDSEFNKIVNCIMTGNNIGYRNRGGNNNMANCGIDANITGILIDDNAGTNGGHGVVSSCSINHSNSNTGYGLIIDGTGRMLIENCNIYYSKLRLENTNGNVISGCGFGQAADWEIEGGECSLFNGCMVRGWDAGNSPVTITNNTAVKIVNCFDRTGTPYA